MNPHHVKITSLRIVEKIRKNTQTKTLSIPYHELDPFQSDLFWSIECESERKEETKHKAVDEENSRIGKILWASRIFPS